LSLCSYLMKGRELMSGGSFKQLTGNWNISLLCMTWTDKEMGSRWTKFNYPVHQAARLNGIIDEASVPDANFCGRKLTIPCRRGPHDHKTRPEILCSSRGNMQFNNLTLQVHRSTRGVKWMLRTLLWSNCAGSGLWVTSDRRAAPCDAHSDGILPYGIRALQTSAAGN
jgi:hypothetical protein